eukprot:370299_1
MALYTAIVEFDFDLDLGNFISEVVETLPFSLEQCIPEHLIFILNQFVFDDVTVVTQSDKILFSPNRSNIISYIQIMEVNGRQLSEGRITRNQFGSKIVEQCNNNKMLLDISVKIYDALIEFDFGLIRAKANYNSNTEIEHKEKMDASNSLNQESDFEQKMNEYIAHANIEIEKQYTDQIQEYLQEISKLRQQNIELQNKLNKDTLK